MPSALVKALQRSCLQNLSANGTRTAYSDHDEHSHSSSAGGRTGPRAGHPHLFQPLDHPQMVASFLRRISPKLAIFLESDFWPNLVIKTAEASIPVAFASSQLSDAARWQKRKSLAKQLFDSARLALAVDQNQADRLVQLGVKSHNVQVTGSLKLPDTAGQPNQISSQGSAKRRGTGIFCWLPPPIRVKMKR